MEGMAAFGLACSGAPPSFLVDGAWYDVRRPRASVATHIQNRHEFMEMLNFLDAALTRDSASAFRERALHPQTGLNVEQITDVFTHVLGEVSGMPYWAAERLVYSAAVDWHAFTAHCGAVDPLRLPLDRFLSFVYAWRIRNGDKEGIEKYDKLLLAPPAGLKVETIAALPEWTKAAQANDFMATLARAGGRPGSAQQPAPPPIDSGEAAADPEVIVGE